MLDTSIILYINKNLPSRYFDALGCLIIMPHILSKYKKLNWIKKFFIEIFYQRDIRIMITTAMTRYWEEQIFINFCINY